MASGEPLSAAARESAAGELGGTKNLDAAQQVWDYMSMGDDVTADTRADAIMVLGSHDMRVAHRGADLFHMGVAPLLIMSGGLGNLTAGVFARPEAEQFADVAIERGVPKEAILTEARSTNSGENCTFTRDLLIERAVAALKARGTATADGGDDTGARRGGIVARTGSDDARDDAMLTEATRQVDAMSFVLVQKPYMERRAFATFRKRWPSATVVAVTSPRFGMLEYAVPAEVAAATDGAGSGLGSGAATGGVDGVKDTRDGAELVAHNDISLRRVVEIMVGDLQRIDLYARPSHDFQIAQDIPATVWAAFEVLTAAGFVSNLVADAPATS